jgi:hypothetical protein
MNESASIPTFYDLTKALPRPILHTIAYDAGVSLRTINQMRQDEPVSKPDAESVLSVLAVRLGRPLSLETVKVACEPDDEDAEGDG